MKVIVVFLLWAGMSALCDAGACLMSDTFSAPFLIAGAVCFGILFSFFFLVLEETPDGC
jgi:hypothetical protein